MNTINIPKLDPNLFTGPIRLTSGIVRMGDITLDSPYGEFARWLYLGTTGNVSIVKWDGTSQTLLGVSAGVWHPIYTLQVNSVGTTALDMVWGS